MVVAVECTNWIFQNVCFLQISLIYHHHLKKSNMDKVSTHKPIVASLVFEIFCDVFTERKSLYHLSNEAVYRLAKNVSKWLINDEAGDPLGLYQ